MKTKTISMMLIGMMILGTITSFGKTTIVKKQNTHVTLVKNQTPDKNCHCKNCEDIHKKQQNTINYCNCKNCKIQKNSTKKCKVTKKGRNCTCKNCNPIKQTGRTHMMR